MGRTLEGSASPGRDSNAVAPPASAARANAAQASAARLSAARVLVVDDHRDMADGIAMLLAEIPLEVEAAYSAREALVKLERSEFALVLTDIRMPSMDGLGLLAEIRARWPKIRVVLMTAYSSIDSAVAAIKQGASDYLVKPFENQAMIDLVQRNLSGEPPGPGDVVAAVAATLTPDDLLASLARALDLLRSATEADDCELFLLEPDGKDALLSVWAGPDEEALLTRTRFGPNVGYPGIVAATGEPLAAQGDLARDPRFLRRDIVERGIRSCACAPLAEARGALGSIHLLSRRPDFPVDRALALLQRAAIPTASTVRAGLAALRQRVDEAGTPHEAGSAAQLRALLDCIRRTANASEGSLALFGTDHGLPARVVSTGPASLLCACAEAGQWVDCPCLVGGHGFAPEASRRSWPTACRRGIPGRVASPCCLPLALNGRSLGLVALDLGRNSAANAAARLVPLLAMTQQAALRIGSAPLEEARGSPASTGSPDAASAAAELELRCLGSFRVFRRGQPIAAEQFSRSKALVLLKLLALKAGTPLSRDLLIELLWPGVDPKSGANRLHGVVHALRSVIEPQRAERSWAYVRNRGDFYYLDLEGPLAIDLVAFKKLARKGLAAGPEQTAAAIATLEEATALYQGDLFEDDPYSEWCEEARHELQALQVTALERLAHLHAQQGAADRAVQHLTRALRLAPIREDLAVSLLETLLRLGRLAEARARYEDFTRQIREDVGADPSPELAEIGLRVSRSSSEPPPRAR
ncbi:MAG: response regulator [Deltaproteobacteria bacterium]|nr:response regulator [Deltaproteobacteria bacterium]